MAEDCGSSRWVSAWIPMCWTKANSCPHVPVASDSSITELIFWWSAVSVDFTTCAIINIMATLIFAIVSSYVLLLTNRMSSPLGWCGDLHNPTTLIRNAVCPGFGKSDSMTWVDMLVDLATARSAQLRFDHLLKFRESHNMILRAAPRKLVAQGWTSTQKMWAD